MKIYTFVNLYALLTGRFIFYEMLSFFEAQILKPRSTSKSSELPGRDSEVYSIQVLLNLRY